MPHMETQVPRASSFDDQSYAMMMHEDSVNVLPQAQAQVQTALMPQTELDESLMHGSWADPMNQFDPYFDYTTFARPWNYHLDHNADTSHWFSSQFFAALRETDLAYSPPFQTWSTTDYDSVNVDITGAMDRSHAAIAPGTIFDSHPSSLSSGDEIPQSSQIGPSAQEGSEEHSGRASRLASPPNESSHEDRLPFAWNPRSRPIARAKPILLPADDPIFANVDRKVEISEATLSRIRDFLRPSKGLSNSEDTFTMPELPLVNVFISLFFNKFLPQVPVIHRPTTEVESLPPSLLAIIMIIGSCYSRLRHTRRFGIIVFDRTRQNLLAAIEEDNGLMREPWIIYAVALVCYMGLWCGNKRAFELSEALRAVAVTYIRRLPNIHDHHDPEFYRGHQSHAYRQASLTRQVKATDTLQSQWLDWATQESHKRLRWFVYMIDAQFPAILGMNGMLTTADIRKWECPCDEDFWTVTTARTWKNRLGSASEPSCPVFGSLTAILLSVPAGPFAKLTELLPSVNTWSANLLMTAIMAEVFHFQEVLVVLRTYEEPSEAQTSDSEELTPTSSRATHLLAMLEIWCESYNQHQVRLDATSSHLQRCSTITYLLARLYLVFPVSEIQDCLGRSGAADAKAAMGRLAAWIGRYLDQAIRAVEDAATCISLIMSNPSESDPYDIIGLFLCHVIVWSFAQTASSRQKEVFIETLQKQQRVLPTVLEVIQAGFSCGGIEDTTLDAPQLIFRHAIQSLVQLGTWGASSNLALLLHLHPGVTG